MNRSTTLAGFATLLIIAALGCSFGSLVQPGEPSSGEKTGTAVVLTNTAVYNAYSQTLAALDTIQQATETAIYQQAITLTQQAAKTQTVIYFVAPEGSAGPIGPIGCDSYLVPVPAGDILPTTSDRQIVLALMDLFAIKEDFVGEDRLFNPLANSSLSVQSVTVNAAGHATIQLTGDYLLTGVCADPLFEAQIEYTALQFPGVNSVSIFIDGVAMEDIVSGRGD